MKCTNCYSHIKNIASLNLCDNCLKLDHLLISYNDFSKIFLGTKFSHISTKYISNKKYILFSVVENFVKKKYMYNEELFNKRKKEKDEDKKIHNENIEYRKIMLKGELDKMNIKNNIEDNFYYNQYIHHEIFTITDKNCKNENFGNITDFIIAANRYNKMDIAADQNRDFKLCKKKYEYENINNNSEKKK